MRAPSARSSTGTLVPTGRGHPTTKWAESTRSGHETRAGGLATDVFRFECARADVVDDAGCARRFAREANAPAVENEDVAQSVPIRPWKKRHQILLDAHWVGVLGPAETLRDSLYVRVDDNTFGRVEGDAEDYVAGLAADARQ